MPKALKRGERLFVTRRCSARAKSRLRQGESVTIKHFGPDIRNSGRSDRDVFLDSEGHWGGWMNLDRDVELGHTPPEKKRKKGDRRSS